MGFKEFNTVSESKGKVDYCMIKVKSRTGESVQQMIKRFKKMCEKEGLIRDIKKGGFYEKPSEVGRRKRKKSERMARIFSSNPA
jgi:small subunit ribosomal protein S21